MNTDEDEEFYTIKEFAKLLKVTPETVRRAIRAGKILALKFGDGKTSSWRIPRIQLDRMALRCVEKYGENNEMV
jgi:excisionase family DNA binding protein